VKAVVAWLNIGGGGAGGAKPGRRGWNRSGWRRRSHRLAALAEMAKRLAAEIGENVSGI